MRPRPRQVTSTGFCYEATSTSDTKAAISGKDVHFPSSSDHQGDRKTLHLAMSLGINIGSEPGSASILCALYR
jgi:hypothetical protein